MNLLQNLRAVVAALAVEAHRPGPITADSSAGAFIRARIAPQGIIGIRRSAAEALQDLVRSLFEADARYQRGMPFKEFEDEVFSALLEQFYEKQDQIVGGADLKILQERLDSWFSENFGHYVAYVPCALVPHSAASFAVGPVLFDPVERFNLDQFADSSFATEDLARLRERMAFQEVSWMATVPVHDVHEKRTTELADLVADVALAILQMTVPLSSSRHMSRLYDLRGPGMRIDLVSQGTHIAGNYRTAGQPGLGLMPGMLEKILADSSHLLAAAGLHLTGLAQNSFSHPTLQMAWCDAAYWFRQGVRDNLDAIAVTKLESALEVMLSAGSATIGRDRMYRAIEALYGRKPNDVINADSATTIKQFVESLVTDRSRILHGTLSTLATPMAITRGQLESFCRTMLRVMALELERYIGSGGTDDVDEFLAWAPSSIHS